jgi:hypothetical protein
MVESSASPSTIFTYFVKSSCLASWSAASWASLTRRWTSPRSASVGRRLAASTWAMMSWAAFAFATFRSASSLTAVVDMCAPTKKPPRGAAVPVGSSGA